MARSWGQFITLRCKECGQEFEQYVYNGDTSYRKCPFHRGKTKMQEIKAGKASIGPVAQSLLPEKKAATDKLETGLVLIPFYSIVRLGSIFIEGLRYGRDNWKKGVHDKEYQEERLEHAFLHLIKYKEGDRSEDHLAKVMWFCATQLELERLEQNA